MKRLLVVSIVSLFCCFSYRAALARGIDTMFDADVEYWFSTLKGEVAVAETGLPGTDVDLIDDLGMDDTENIPVFNLSYRFLDQHRLSFSYSEVEHSGRKNITKEIDYKGETYIVGADVTSNTEVTLIEGRYEYIFLWNEIWELAGLVGAKYARIETTLEASGYETKTESIEAPIPVVGLVGEVKLLDNFSLSGEVSGITLDVSDLDFTLIDAALRLSYDFTENWRVSAGYRLLDIDGSDDDNEVNVTLHGPMVAVIGSF